MTWLFLRRGSQWKNKGEGRPVFCLTSPKPKALANFHFSRTSKNASTEWYPKPTRRRTLPATKVTTTRKAIETVPSFPRPVAVNLAQKEADWWLCLLPQSHYHTVLIWVWSHGCAFWWPNKDVLFPFLALRVGLAILRWNHWDPQTLKLFQGQIACRGGRKSQAVQWSSNGVQLGCLQEPGG